MKVGIEIEFVSATRAEIQKHVPKGFFVVSDGSVRNYAPGGSILVREYKDTIECGGEIVSPPLEEEEISQMRKVLLALGGEFLEVAYSTSSIHIHVDATWMEFEQVKKLYSKAVEWEQFFYNISVPEKQKCHRGEFNNFIYCRPLKSPPYAAWSGRPTYVSSTYGKVEDTKNLTEFAYTLGNFPERSNKWHPPRYVSINFCALFTHGTIEFRVFNFTTNFCLLKAWVKTCANFVKMLGEGSPEIWAGELFPTLEKNYREVKLDTTPVLTHLGKKIRWVNGNPLNPPLAKKPPLEVKKPSSVEGLENRTTFIRRENKCVT